MEAVSPDDTLEANATTENHAALPPLEVEGEEEPAQPLSSSSTVVAAALAPLLVSPRQEAALKASVPFTPTTSADAHKFKYYCPLCMEHFAGIFKSTCCGNYTCLGCTVEYLSGKGIQAATAADILANVGALRGVPCPHCFTNGFCPTIVQSEDVVRDYKGTVPGSGNGGNSNLTVSPRSSNNSNGGIAFQGAARAMTPLKVGDTFEDLKRKMIPFGGLKAAAPTADGQKNAGMDEHDKENVRAHANGGVRISPRAPPAAASSSSSRIGAVWSPDGVVEPAERAPLGGIAASCPTARRTVRLSVGPAAAAAGTGSAAASPLTAYVGRNLFGASDPPADAFYQPLYQQYPQQQQRPGASGIAPFSVPPSPAGSDGAPSSSLPSGGRYHLFADATPRSRAFLSHAATGMVEEIIGEVVGRRRDRDERAAGIAC